MLWTSARYTRVEATATPGAVKSGDNGETNEVATIILRGPIGVDAALAIEGRPEDLVALARQFMAAAEAITRTTMRDPALRRLYGMSQLGTTDEGNGS